MKKIFTLGLLLLIYSSSRAQSITLGANLSINKTTLFHHIEESPLIDQNKLFSLGTGIGIDFKLSFGEGSYYSNGDMGIEFNPSFFSINQKYNGTFINPADTLPVMGYASKVSLKFLELPLLFYTRGESGLYAEIGISIGFTQTAKGSFSTDSLQTTTYRPFNYSDSTITRGKLFSTSNFSGVLGFGIVSELSDQVMLTTGIRITYGISDLTSPVANVNGTYFSTHTASMGILLGLAYKFDNGSVH